MYTFSANTKAKSAEVNANFTGLSNGTEDTDTNSLLLMRADLMVDFIKIGCIWSRTSGLIGAMTSGVIYITDSNGDKQRVAVSAIASKTFTASKDTYVYVDSAGAITYDPQTNGAATPTIPANKIQIALVVSDASNVTYIIGTAPRAYDEIARCTLIYGSRDSMPIGNIPARRYLQLIWSLIPTGGTINPSIRYNGDSSNNYSSRLSSNGGADSTSVSQSSNFLDTNGGQNMLHWGTMNILNVATQEKLSYSVAMTQDTAGAGAAPNRREQAQKWINTSAQISSVLVTNGGTGDFAISSELIIKGSD